jgi:prophage antirepressor-like protein
MEQSQGLALVDMFSYQGNSLRHMIINDEPWWVAGDVCKILEHSDVSMAVSRLDEDEKLIQALFVSGQHRNTFFVNESGVYHLIFTSRKLGAQTFRKWVTSEVLPAIRKTGSYSLQGLGSLDYLDQIIEKQREILRGYRKVKHQERKRLGLVVPRTLQQNDLPPQELLLNFLQAQPVPVTIREITQYAPMNVRRLKADGIRVLLIEMQVNDLVTVKTQGKAVGYQLVK